MGSRYDALSAVKGGFSLAARTWDVGLVMSALWAAAAMGLGWAFAFLAEAYVVNGTPDSASLVQDVSGGVFLLCVAVLIMRFMGSGVRDWSFPMFFLPFGQMTAAAYIRSLAPGGTDDIVIGLYAQTGWFLALFLVGGPAIAMMVKAADMRSEGPATFGEIVAASRASWKPVRSAVMVRAVVVAAGMMIIIPGVIYAMLFAFVGIAAVREPETSPFQLSQKVATRIRGSIFRVLALWFIASMVLALGVAAIVGQPGMMMEFLLMGSAEVFGPVGWGLLEFGAAVLNWIVLMAFVHMYNLRMEDRAAAQKAQTA